jgi:glycosyltransferase involved in cell wall biosynthesis
MLPPARRSSPVNVLLFSTFDRRGGAFSSARRLLDGLRGIGVDAKMLVQVKSTDRPDIVQCGGRVATDLAPLRHSIDNLALRLYPRRTGDPFSVSWLPDRKPAVIDRMKPDLVNLHWVTGGAMRIESFPRLSRPVVWTLHDSWAFTGGCHLPLECTRFQQACGACPALDSSSVLDLSRWGWRRKKAAWNKVRLTVVAPSRWLAAMARSSSLLEHARIEVIPYGLDASVFRPRDRRQVREVLGLPQERRLILVAAHSFHADKRNKGEHLVTEALRRLRAVPSLPASELLICGSYELRSFEEAGFRIHPYGWVHDEVTMSLLYSAADVFVLPSIVETLPNTVMEAMACGTPTVAFAVGGIPDLLSHRREGYLARPYDVDDLAAGIEWCLTDSDASERLGRSARQRVEAMFTNEIQARSYQALFRELLGEQR